MVIGLYPMVADILHCGHVISIELAKRQCDWLIVALHCNPIYKVPIQSVYERYMQLRSVKYIDEIIPYSNKDDVELLLRSLQFDKYFLGEDYIGKEFEGKSLLIELHKEIVYLPRKHLLSSTELKLRICKDE